MAARHPPCRALKPKEKDYKVTDRDGMYVHVTAKGAMSFRMDCQPMSWLRSTMQPSRPCRNGHPISTAFRAFPDKIDRIQSWSGMQSIQIGRSWSETKQWPRINYRRCTLLA